MKSNPAACIAQASRRALIEAAKDTGMEPRARIASLDESPRRVAPKTLTGCAVWLALAATAAAQVNPPANPPAVPTDRSAGKPVGPTPANPSKRAPIWPDQWPWSSVGRVNIASATQRGMCTGTLIGPRTVLTAAHCLFDRRRNDWVPANIVHFVAGLAPGNKFRGHSIVASFLISPSFRQGAKDDADAGPAVPSLLARGRASMPMAINDWALLTLRETVDLRPIAIKAIVRAELPGGDANLEIALPGYGADRAFLLSAHRGCSAWTDVARLGPGSLVHGCDQFPGNSGAPVLLLQKDDAVVIGISTSAPSDNRMTLGPAHMGFGVSATQFEQAARDALR